MYVVRRQRVKLPLFFACPILINPLYSLQIFGKYSNTKFHVNPSTGSPVVTCGRKDGQRDKKKWIIVFRNSANASKIVSKLDSRRSTRTHSFVIKMAGGRSWEFLYQSDQLPRSLKKNTDSWRQCFTISTFSKRCTFIRTKKRLRT